MPANDTVDLIFEDPDHVQWEKVSRLVTALEGVMGAALNYIFNMQGRNVGEAPPFPPAVLTSPKRGSLIIPLLFDMPDFHMTLMYMTPSGPMPREEGLRSFISGLSDVAGILEFMMHIVVGPRSAISRTTDQTTRPPEGQLELKAAEAAGQVADQTQAVIQTLIKEAESIGCSSIRIRYRECEVELLRADPVMSRSRLGRTNPRERSMTNQNASFQRLDEPSIRIEYAGREHLGFLARLNGETRRTIMLGRSEKDIVPLETRFEVIGSYVMKDDLKPLDPVPEDWQEAEGVFVITGLRNAEFV